MQEPIKIGQETGNEEDKVDIDPEVDLAVKNEDVAAAADETLDEHMAHNKLFDNDKEVPSKVIQLKAKPEEQHKAVMPNAPVVEHEIKAAKDAQAEKTANEPVLVKSDHPRLEIPKELAAVPPAGVVQKVLLFTYMRGGSSFLGQMFDKNPDAMYLFEPLDGAYSSMYGVPLLVPSLDLTHHVNGTKRFLQFSCYKSYLSNFIDFVDK